MGLFSNAFRSMSKGILGNPITKLSGLPGTALLSGLNKYKDRLVSESAYYDSFIGALTMSSDLINDDFVDNSQIHYSDNELKKSTVPQEYVDEFLTALGEATNNGDASPASICGVTLTDGTGRLYNVFNHTANPVIINGNEILFAMTYSPSKLQEAIVYRDDDGVYLNNLIRTADYVKNTAQRTLTQTTIKEILASAYYIKFNELPQDENSIFTLLRYLGDEVTTSDNIIGLIREILNDPDFSGDIYDGVTAVWHLMDETYPLPSNGKGTYVSLWAVLSDLVESSALNTAILSVINCITGGLNKATEITTLAISFGQNKYNVVRAFGQGISHAFNRGGVYGVGCYITNYIKDLVESVESSDGTMSFTDNSRLTPKNFIVGMLPTIVSTISTLIGALVTAFQPIIGGAILLVGNVVSQIFKFFEYNYSDTLSAINTNDDVILPTAPYGVVQLVLNYSEAEGWLGDVGTLIKQGESLCYVEIPGGFGFIGIGEYDSEGNIININVEFHPSIIDGSYCFNRLLQELVYNECVSLSINSEPSISGPGKVKWNMDWGLVTKDEMIELVSSLWKNNVQDFAIINQENNRLSEDDDALLRKYISQNLFIMAVYLEVCTSSDVYSILNYNESDYYKHVNTSTYFMGTATGPWYAVTEYGIDYVLDTDGSYDIHTNLSEYRTGSTGYHKEWADISSYCLSDQFIKPVGTNPYHFWYAMFEDHIYYGDAYTLSGSVEHAIFIPDYDRRSFWWCVVGTMVTTTVIVGVSIAAVLGIRKVIQRRRAINQARIEKAHDELKAHPDAEHYEIYRHEVRKNNLMANLIGGSKFDYVNYWNGDTGATNPSSGAIDGYASSGFIINGVKGLFKDDQYNGILAENYGSEGLIDNDRIYHAIVGQ